MWFPIYTGKPHFKQPESRRILPNTVSKEWTHPKLSSVANLILLHGSNLSRWIADHDPLAWAFKSRNLIMNWDELDASGKCNHMETGHGLPTACPTRRWKENLHWSQSRIHWWPYNTSFTFYAVLWRPCFIGETGNHRTRVLSFLGPYDSFQSAIFHRSFYSLPAKCRFS